MNRQNEPDSFATLVAETRNQQLQIDACSATPCPATRSSNRIGKACTARRRDRKKAKRAVTQPTAGVVPTQLTANVDHDADKKLDGTTRHLSHDTSQADNDILNRQQVMVRPRMSAPHPPIANPNYRLPSYPPPVPPYGFWNPGLVCDQHQSGLQPGYPSHQPPFSFTSPYSCSSCGAWNQSPVLYHPLNSLAPPCLCSSCGAWNQIPAPHQPHNHGPPNHFNYQLPQFALPSYSYVIWKQAPAYYQGGHPPPWRPYPTSAMSSSSFTTASTTAHPTHFTISRSTTTTNTSSWSGSWAL